MTALMRSRFDNPYGDEAVLSETGGLQAVGPRSLLRSVLIGSAGVVGFVSGYGPYLPHVGTSPSVVDRRTSERQQAGGIAAAAASELRESLVLPAASQTRELLTALSLNKSQLAQVLRITRPTLYGWLEGNEPNHANAKRLATLIRILARAGVTGVDPLNARFVRRSLGEDVPSLLDALSQEELDEQGIAFLLRDARDLGETAARRRHSREDRLRQLGFEEPSTEQRKQQLAKNVSLLQWPES